MAKKQKSNPDANLGNLLGNLIARKARAEVEILLVDGEQNEGDMLWQIRRVKSGMLAELGVFSLMGASETAAIMKAARRSAAEIEGIDDPVVQAQAAADAAAANGERVMKLVLAREENLKALDDAQDAILCAGVEGAKGRLHDDQGWDEALFFPLRLVANRADEDRDDGIVWVGDLAKPDRDRLAAAIKRLSSAKDEVLPFRTESGGALDPGPSSQTLLKVAT